MSTLAPYEIATLDKLVKNGDIYAYKLTETGVRIEFNSGLFVEFSANADMVGNPFVEIEETA